MADDRELEKTDPEKAQEDAPAAKPARKLEVVKRVNDASDLSGLWMDSKLGDGITTAYRHVVPIGKPKDFFRTHPLDEYRRRTEIYVHKVEGEIEETVYIIGPALRGQIEEARPCILVTVVDREGEPRLWPVKFPKEGEKDNDAWKTARVACRKAIDKWVKVIWVKRSYHTREAEEGYAPTPDFAKLPPYDDLVAQAVGEHGIIWGTDHKMYRALMGKKPTKPSWDDEEI